MADDLKDLWDKAAPVEVPEENLSDLWEKAAPVAEKPSVFQEVKGKIGAIGRGISDVLPRAKVAGLAAQLGNDYQREKDHPFTPDEVKRYAEAHPVPLSEAHPEANAAGMPRLRKALGLDKQQERMVPMSLDKALEALYAERGAKTSKEAYAQGKKEDEAETEAIREKRPWSFAGGNAFGNLALAAGAPGLGLSGKVPEGAGLLQTMKAAAGAAGRVGALEAASKADWENPRQAAKETLAQGALGYGLGGTLGGLGYGAGKVLRAALRGVVKPSEAAQTLQKAGVKLTPGEMDPRGALAQLEENATSLPIAGPKLREARLAARRQWQDAVLNEGRAPGAEPIARSGADETVSDALSRVYEGFGKAYGTIGEVPVQPAVLHGDRVIHISDAFDAAVNDPKIIADDALRGAVRKFLSLELTKLPRPSSPGIFSAGGGEAVKSIPAKTLLDMRSSIRGAIRDELKANNLKAAQLLQNAEGALTSSLELQLPSQAAEALGAADKQYANYKVVEDAVRRALDSPEGFTPHQLGMAIRSGSNASRYARGGGGKLRELSAAGREIFDTRSPMTGHRSLSEYATKAAAPLLSTQTGQELLTGTSPAQLRLQMVLDALRNGAPAADAPVSWTQGFAPELGGYAYDLAYGRTH